MIVLAVPVVLSELGWMAQGVVDNIMVGRLGPEAIGAVSLGNAVYYTPCLFGIGLLLGLDTLVSQAYGRHDHDECHRWLAQGVYLACIVTPPLMLLVVVAQPFGFTRFGVTASVAVPASSYLRILGWSTLPLLLYGGTRRYLQGVGQVRVITLTYVLANLLNWGGQLGPHLWKARIPGARREWFRDLHLRRSRRHGGGADRLCLALRAHARASAVSTLGWAAMGSTPDSWCASARLPPDRFCSRSAHGIYRPSLRAISIRSRLATHAIALNYASISYMVPLGVSAAAAVSVGHAVGAGDPARARRAGWLALALGTVLHGSCRHCISGRASAPHRALHARSAGAAGRPESALDRRGFPDLRRYPDRLYRRAARPRRNARSHDCQLYRLLDSWSAARTHICVSCCAGESTASGSGSRWPWS